MSNQPNSEDGVHVLTPATGERTGSTSDLLPPDPRGSGRRWRLSARVDTLSGLYLIVVMIVLFSLWEPATFATVTNLRVTAASQAITGIITLAAVVSLASGVFDLSIGANMSFSISLIGVLQAQDHVNAILAILITIACGALIGVANAIIVTVFKVDAVIGTLGMQSLLAAASFWLAQGNTILNGISPAFTDAGTGAPGGIPLPLIYFVVIAIALWYVLEHTPFGRYLYAVGGNIEATRLAGVRVIRMQWYSLMISGALASVAGIVLTMSLGAASYGAGDSYLLPAFAATFLGATQIRPGRFNVVGTIIAVYLLAVGIKGFQLHYPSVGWIQDAFEGAALIVAVTLAGQAARRRARSTSKPRSGDQPPGGTGFGSARFLKMFQHVGGDRSTERLDVNG